MSDAAGTTLTLQEVTDIIAKARSGSANPMLIGLQIFNSLGDSVTVSGDTLRLALAASALPVAGPLGTLVDAIQSVSKVGSHITTVNNQKIETTLNGNRIRFDEEVTFDVSGTNGAPGLKNISGVAAHKAVAWIGIQAIQLQQNEGGWTVGVSTHIGTINFNLDAANP